MGLRHPHCRGGKQHELFTQVSLAGHMPDMADATPLSIKVHVLYYHLILFMLVELFDIIDHHKPTLTIIKHQFMIT